MKLDNLNFQCPRCGSNQWGESDVDLDPHGFCKGRNCLFVWPRSDDSKYHHEPMKQPQDQNQELKERLAGVPQESILCIWQEKTQDHLAYNAHSLFQAAYKRIVLLERENEVLRSQLPSPESAWIPKFKVGDRVRVTTPMEKREGRISDVGANKLYQLAEDGEASGVWFQEDELEAAPEDPAEKAFKIFAQQEGISDPTAMSICRRTFLAGRASK